MMWSYNFVLIHPERTSGTVLTNAFGVLPYVSKEVYINKHCRASKAKRIVGPIIWNNPNTIKICLSRDEDERNLSWYNHINKSYKLLMSGDLVHADHFWKSFIRHHGIKSKDKFDKTIKLPPVSWYCDQPGIKIMTGKEAYGLLIELTQYNPNIQVY